MTTIGLIASILVGAAFVLAGASKLAAGRSWTVQARDLGAPAWTVPIVPWFELVVGASVAVGLARPWPAVVAAALLVVFTALIVARIREGKRPPCACFGAWSAKPIGAGHILRNGVLFALSVVALLA